MKIKNLLTAVCLVAAANTYAQDCIVPVSIHLEEEFSNVPVAAQTILNQSLNRIAT